MSECTDHSCQEGCCNYYGTCPQQQDSNSYVNKCFHYYENNNDSSQFPVWAIGPIFFASIFLLIFICAIVRRAQANKEMQVVNIGGGGGTQNVIVEQLQPPYNQHYNAGHNQPYNQPYLQQPVYNNPYQQQQPHGLFGVAAHQHQQRQGPIIYG